MSMPYVPPGGLSRPRRTVGTHDPQYTPEELAAIEAHRKRLAVADLMARTSESTIDEGLGLVRGALARTAPGGMRAQPQRPYAPAVGGYERGIDTLPGGAERVAAQRGADQRAADVGVGALTRLGAQVFAPDPTSAVTGALGVAGKLAPAVAAAVPLVRRTLRMPLSPPRKPRRSIVNPELRQMDLGDATTYALSGQHLKQHPATGQYVGAPPGTTAKPHLRRMRADYDKLVEEGLEGADWYKRVRELIRELSGGDPVRAQRIADELAVTSQQATPDANLGFMLTGHNRLASGEPVDVVHTGRIGEQLEAAWAGRHEVLGPKVGVYSDHINPFKPHPVTGTNDIWQMRAFGYPANKAAPSTSEHAFMDSEGLLAAARANDRALGGRTDWTPEEIQAAAWVRIKGESLTQKPRKNKLPLREGIRRANETYVEPLSRGKYVMNEPYELRPGASAGVQTPLNDPSYAHWAMTGRTPQTMHTLKPPGREPIVGGGGRDPVGDPYWDEWSDRLRDVMLDPETGEDRIHRALGSVQRQPEYGLGAYVNDAGVPELNRSVVAHPLGSYEPHDVTGRTVPQHVRRKMSDAARFRGGLLGQESMAWNAALREGQSGVKAGGLTGLRMDLPGPLSREQGAGLLDFAGRHGFTDETGGFMSPQGREVIFQRYADPLEMTPAERTANARGLTKTARAMERELGAVTPPGVQPPRLERARIEGDYIPLPAAEGPQSLTIEAIANLDPHNLALLDENEDIRSLALQLLEEHKRFADETGRHARKGMLALFRYVAQGGPSAALAAARRGEITNEMLVAGFTMLGLGRYLQGRGEQA